MTVPTTAIEKGKLKAVRLTNTEVTPKSQTICLAKQVIDLTDFISVRSATELQDLRRTFDDPHGIQRKQNVRFIQEGAAAK